MILRPLGLTEMGFNISRRIRDVSCPLKFLKSFFLKSEKGRFFSGYMDHEHQHILKKENRLFSLIIYILLTFVFSIYSK